MSFGKCLDEMVKKVAKLSVFMESASVHAHCIIKINDSLCFSAQSGI